jgi:CubicO group peptidase (beta-lactamase class C family)
LLCALTTLTNFSYSQSKEELKHTIINLLDEQKLSGAVWATISDKGEIFTDSYGYKNTATKKVFSPTDKVNVGSVSKTILAAGFLRMATLELIKLDEPVKKLFAKSATR